MRSTKEWLQILLLMRRSVRGRHGNKPPRPKNAHACSGSLVYTVMVTSGAHCSVKTSKMALSVSAIALMRPCGAFDEAWCEKLPPAPGAQPAPSEKDEPIRKAWARFSNALHRSPDAPYPGMSEAFEQHFSQSFTDREWRAESATWAAAWKAAKRHEAQAQPAPSIPEGWKLVPIEPTQEMRDAWELAPVCEYADAVFRCAYREMLAAAPEAKP